MVQWPSLLLLGVASTSACGACGGDRLAGRRPVAVAGIDSGPTKATPPPPEAADPRARRMVEGLERLVDDLESGERTPHQAFEQLEVLERVVGPPVVELPALEVACTADTDCALAGLGLEQEHIGGLCCPSLQRTAGTAAWVRRLEQVCRSYEPLRGRRPIDLPPCGVISGPISATRALCKAARCVACLEPNDGSPLLCSD